MAEPKKITTKPLQKVPDKPEKLPNKKSKVFKILLFIFALLILLGALFAASVFFGIVDVQKFGKEHNLQNYPVIGSYFAEPKTNFSPVELDMGTNTDIQPNASNLPQTPNNALSQPVSPNTPVITDPNGEKIDLKKLEQQKQQEEAKRISKLARLYGGMKPEEAVPILNRLDDDTVVAILSKMEDDQVSKILAAFDAGRSARLTQVILRGQPQRSLGI